MLQHLLGIEETSASDINALLARAALFASQASPEKILRGRLVATLFFEASTRTRTSFELAAQRLGAEVLSFTASTSSTSKGETLSDTAKTIDAMGPDIVIVRHASAGVPWFLAGQIKARIVNAGDGAHEHPTQALLDAYVLGKHLKDLRQKKIVIVGDILHSRVARSNLFLLDKLGAEVHLVGPASLCPATFTALGAKAVHHKLEDALPGAHAVMALRLQRERMGRLLVSSVGEYFARYALTEAKLSQYAPKAIVMHPGPMNRGVEIDATLADSPRSVVLAQVSAGVLIRMAVLEAIAQSLSVQVSGVV
jgi:aspartate carbamoyltransferase catalytic subunit